MMLTFFENNITVAPILAEIVMPGMMLVLVVKVVKERTDVCWQVFCSLEI